MPADNKLLRLIPKVDEVLAYPEVAACAEESRAAATRAVREILDELRAEIIAGSCAEVPDSAELVRRIAGRVRLNELPGLRRVINATGVILHTNLGRAPLARAAVEAVCDAARDYSALEYNIADGSRGSRHAHVAGLLRELTGAEDALVVNNNASAVLLMLCALARGGEVIVSRGELVEIGGAFRIPDVMAQSGCALREAGTTNRTRAADYENAIVPGRTSALFKAHTSNFRIVGFTEEVPLAELVGLGRRHGLPVLYDLGGGSMLPLEQYGIRGEPCVSRCVAEGADILSFSGDKLLGGPQAGIVVGRAEYISKMKKHPLARAVRIDKLTLAALEATLRLYRDPELAISEIPTLSMLTAPRNSLLKKAESLAGILGPLGEQVSVVECEGQTGGGTAPMQELPSAAVSIRPDGIGVDELERQLRGCEVPIVARIARDSLLLDARTIEERDFEYIAGRLLCILGGKA